MRPTIPLALALVVLGSAAGARTQGVNAEGAVDTIVGSDVREQERSAAADAKRVVAAIERAAESAEAVRRLTRADRVDIVFLPDAAPTEGGPPAEIEAKLEQRDAEIAALRQEVEGNALLFHAINARQILMRDVLAVEVSAGAVTVYAAAKPSN